MITHLHACDRCAVLYACAGDLIRTDLPKREVCAHFDVFAKHHPFRLCPECAVSQPQERTA